jgi:hypothetical protein
MFLEDECEKIDWDYDGAGQWWFWTNLISVVGL